MSIEHFIEPNSYRHTTFQRRLSHRENEAGITHAPALDTSEKRAEQYRRLGSMIGHTPLIHVPSEEGMVLAKVESQNPSESHYDRAYFEILKRLEADGIIRPGDELIENTSGSAGISFAWLCSRLGFKPTVLVSRLPEGRMQELKNFRARIIDVEKGGIPATSRHLIGRMEELRQAGYQETRHRTHDYTVFTYEKGGHRVCFPNHSANQLTVDAFSEIGREVADVLPPGVSIDYFISVIGNWTTTIGIQKGLKDRFKRLQVVGVENASSADNFSRKYGEAAYRALYPDRLRTAEHTSLGGSVPTLPGEQELKLRFRNLDAVDEIRLVEEGDRDLTREGYNRDQLTVDTIGNTSAEALYVARKIQEERPEAITLIVFYDKGDRYSSFDLAEWSALTRGEIAERLRLQPKEWRQETARVPQDIPRSIMEAYRTRDLFQSALSGQPRFL